MNVEFTDTSNSLTCVAGVVYNLLHSPKIQWTAGNTLLNSVSGFSLTEGISSSDAGLFNCTVCIDIREADIENHCSTETLEISRSRECFICLNCT